MYISVSAPILLYILFIVILFSFQFLLNGSHRNHNCADCDPEPYFFANLLQNCDLSRFWKPICKRDENEIV